MKSKLDRGILLLSLLVYGISICECQNEYEACRQPFECGSLRNVYYPFSGGNRPPSCGYRGYDLTCKNDVTLINSSSIIYRVLAYDNQTRSIRVARNDLWSIPCAQILQNVTETSLFNFYSPANDQDISLIYGCTASPLPQPNQFNCSGSGNGIGGIGFYLTSGVNASIFTCTGPQINVRISQTAAAVLAANPSTVLLQTSLQSGFSIQWSADDERCQSCNGSGGICGSDPGSGSFACYCVDGRVELTCANSTDQNNAAPPSGEYPEVEGENEERRRARMERHQRTQERAAKALAEKNQRDLHAQREQEERHRIAESLDFEIKRWAAGKETNLRALLSTLQYVLWPECGWQLVSLTDLITGASVKKAYRKATLCIHPDKVQQKGATLQQKYIAEKVFDLLKEAWNKFNSEELF